jgi:SAM-dependent methyltransferase
LRVARERETLLLVPVLEELTQDYAAWWIDFLGEHNHIGGEDATRWLLDRSRLSAGDRMLDCGAFVGASARYAARRSDVRAVAADLNRDFLAAGQRLRGGPLVQWVPADTRRLPFGDGAFASVWSLDSFISPREMSRVAASRSTVCLCCETPIDSRGGLESFLDEWREYGWEMAAHRSMTMDAIQVWRRAEAEMVGKRRLYEERYGKRPYLGQLDLVGYLVQAYERGGMGHSLIVFARG